MAEVIHKYGPFAYGSSYLSVQGIPVHVGLQDGSIFVWTRKLADVELAWTTVMLVATGEYYSGNYIGTVILPSGFVFHAIEVM